MLRTLQQLFETRIRPEADSADPAVSEHGLRLAAGALLVEMTRADHEVSSDERAATRGALQRAFGLSPSETEELLALAEAEADRAVSLHQFTHLINRHFSAERKRHVVELLWRVAYADGRLDKYEEHLVRKVAELLYVPHEQFIRAKYDAAPDE